MRHCILCGVYLGLFFSIYAVSVVPFQCNVLFFCVFVVSFFPLFPPPPLPSLPSPSLPPRSSILSRTGRKENQEASNLAVPMTMCLFPVPFPLTPSLRPQVSSINPTVTRSLLYSVLRDAPSDRGGQGQQSRDAQLSEYPSLDYQGLYVTLVTLLDLVPLLQHGQHGESRPSCTTVVVIIIPESSGSCMKPPLLFWPGL